MKWELDALKILARNESVPSVALLDAIGEIEKLREQQKWIPCAERLPDSTNESFRVLWKYSRKVAYEIGFIRDGKVYMNAYTYIPLKVFSYWKEIKPPQEDEK